MMTFVAEPAERFGNCTQEVARARAVDFDAFYRSEYAGALRFAYVLTGRMTVAEELTQDAFLAAYRNWDRIGSYDDPDRWLLGTLSNACASWWRRATTELRLVKRLRGERSVAPEFPERDEQVLEAVRRLPARQREVIALVLLEDRSVADTAAILGCGEETVRTHLRRGRRALAEVLRLPEDDPDGERAGDPEDRQ
jgi:RNA polymerase sigma-70 factor (ECF subfamily)